jgi:hypothetical protein
LTTILNIGVPSVGGFSALCFNNREGTPRSSPRPRSTTSGYIPSREGGSRNRLGWSGRRFASAIFGRLGSYQTEAAPSLPTGLAHRGSATVLRTVVAADPTAVSTARRDEGWLKNEYSVKWRLFGSWRYWRRSESDRGWR